MGKSVTKEEKMRRVEEILNEVKLNLSKLKTPIFFLINQTHVIAQSKKM